MALDHRDAGARRAHVGGMRLDAALAEPAEDLPRLRRDLLLLLRDVRDHVVDDVEREHARRAAGAGQSLQRRHEHTLDAERVLERLQRDHEPDGRAVRLWNDEALPAAATSLLLDE